MTVIRQLENRSVRKSNDATAPLPESDFKRRLRAADQRLLSDAYPIIFFDSLSAKVKRSFLLTVMRPLCDLLSRFFLSEAKKNLNDDYKSNFVFSGPFSLFLVL